MARRRTRTDSRRLGWGAWITHTRHEIEGDLSAVRPGAELHVPGGVVTVRSAWDDVGLEQRSRWADCVDAAGGPVRVLVRERAA